MRKKLLYSSLGLTIIYVLVSVYFSIKHPISIWKEDVKLWETIIYNVFEFFGSTSDILHLITGLPTFIFQILLFLTIWFSMYILFLIGHLIFRSIKNKTHENYDFQESFKNSSDV